MRVSQAVFGVFHHFELAHQLRRYNYLDTVYSTYPWRRLQRERLPRELRGSATGFGINPTMQRAGGGFKPVYRTSDEAAAELSNGTVHGVLHLGWVERGKGHYGAQMGIYVKPRGRLGGPYLKLIEPFRHLIVYPALMRQIERAWAGPGR